MNFIIFLAGKTIIFDLDETLVHCNEGDKLPADTYLDIKFPTGEIIRVKKLKKLNIFY